MKLRIILALTILLLSLSSLLVLWQADADPTNQGQRLFFDDFTSSQLSPNWNPTFTVRANAMGGNLTQQGGWMSLAELSSLSTSTTWCNGGSGCLDDTGIIASNISPIVSNTTAPQFIFMAWRMIPFNLTQVGNNPSPNNAVRNAEVLLGLRSVGSTYGGIGFQLVETDSVQSPMRLGATNQRESVGLWIQQPMNGLNDANCFYGNGIAGLSGNVNGGGVMPGFQYSQNLPVCGISYPALIYSNPNNPIDLNSLHIFSMQMSLKRDGTSWVSFQVDGNAWYNVTQTACGCIEGNSQTNNNNYGTMYPYIATGYCTGTVSALQNSAGGACTGPTPNQSLGTMVDYVLVYNYVPSSLPAGQAVPNPGISGQIGPQGLRSTFPNYLVALAYELGKGIPLGSSQFLMSQVQFGGFLLFLITIMVITIPGVILHVRNPMIYSFLAFIISIIYFGLGVLALWFFGSIVLLFLGIMVGTVPASLRHTGGGGEVE